MTSEVIRSQSKSYQVLSDLAKIFFKQNSSKSLQTHIVQNTEIKMRDNVFDSRATVHGLTYSQNQPLGSEETRYRGRGSDGHGTRVIRRTDLR